MKKFLSAVAVFCAFATPVSAAPMVLDFEGYAPGTTIGADSLAPLGVVFNLDLDVVSGIGDLPSSGTNSVIAGGYGGFSGWFVGPYAGGVNLISVFAGDDGGDIDSVILRGFNAANELVAMASFAGEAAQWLTITGSGIVSFEIEAIGLVAFDDFTFGSAQVPEPAAVGLLGLGLVGIGALRRRKAA